MGGAKSAIEVLVDRFSATSWDPNDDMKQRFHEAPLPGAIATFSIHQRGKQPASSRAATTLRPSSPRNSGSSLRGCRNGGITKVLHRASTTRHYNGIAFFRLSDRYQKGDGGTTRTIFGQRCFAGSSAARRRTSGCGGMTKRRRWTKVVLHDDDGGTTILHTSRPTGGVDDSHTHA